MDERKPNDQQHRPGLVSFAKDQLQICQFFAVRISFLAMTLELESGLENRIATTMVGLIP
jgi:hypothetical protein